MIKYLTHKLELLNGYTFTYKCKLCNVTVYLDENKYFWRRPAENYNWNFTIKLNEDCNELIIKRLLE